MMAQNKILIGILALGLILVTPVAASKALQGDTTRSAAKSEPIPMDQLGAVAGKQYSGDGLTVTATSDGARLRCVFQKLEGEATREGLWLTSTVDGAKYGRFRVVASLVAREVADQTSDIRRSTFNTQLNAVGKVEVAEQVARFIRPGVTEEYSVSVDGVRQDFVVLEKPEGAGELRLELDLTGAKAEPLVNGARLTLDGSGRKIAYNRVRVTDATGKEFKARMDVETNGARRSRRFDAASRASAGDDLVALEASGMKRPEGRAPMLAILVEDAEAVYPIRIDPTFSDGNWMSMGTVPGTDGDVSDAVVDAAGNLYIGGRFNVVGDVIAKYVAKWNGSAWSALGSGIGGSDAWVRVNALAVSGTNLYAGGVFTTAGGVSANYIAKWNGNAWSALGSGMGGISPYVYALAVSGTNLYAGGSFSAAGGMTVNQIAKWDGNAWSALGEGMGGDYYPGVYALAVSGTNLYAGGEFTRATNAGPVAVAVNNIARWDGSAWSALGSGMNSSVGELAVSGTNLYAGGEFTTVGGSAANYIAKWNGSAWSALGSGMDGDVCALAVSGTNLYAGGWFTTAGGVTVNMIAKWDGNAWSALGDGPDDVVYALAVSGTNLYAGGSFNTAGRMEANSIAKWDGSSWSALGDGMNSAVATLAVSGTNLYAGGFFREAGGVGVYHVAKWDGSAWSALGSGMDDDVYALAVSGTNLYAGGWFTTAGGVTVNRIAKWDGSAWSALGEGMDGGVYALAVSGTNLYAGGSFSAAGGMEANSIAKWDGSSWSALGSGMGGVSPYVRALAVSAPDLYAGGTFTTAGGKVSAYMAKAGLASISLEITSTVRSGTNLVFDGTGGIAGRNYYVLTSTNVATRMTNWMRVTTNTFGVGGAFSVTNAVNPAQRRQFFRLQVP